VGGVLILCGVYLAEREVGTERIVSGVSAE
jgi:hypothetical protein